MSAELFARPPGHDVLFEIGTVTDVGIDANGAVVAHFQLSYHGIGIAQDTATAKVLVGYLGTGFGQFNEPPTIGTMALLCFPGMGHDGGSGGDVDDGFVVMFLPTKAQPVPAGVIGPYDGTRRILKTQQNIATDEHLQGNLDRTIDGHENTHVVGTTGRTLDGDVTETLGGNRTTTVAKDVSETLSGKRTASVAKAESQTNSDAFTRNITKDGNWQGAQQLIMAAVTNLLLSGAATAQVSSSGTLTIKVGSNTLVVTSSSITLTVGSSTISLTSSGLTLNGTAITLAGLLTLPVGTHVHVSGSPGVNTSVPVAPGTAW